MMRLLMLMLLASANALTCNEIQTVFFDSGCCSGTDETCLQQIPTCASTTNGKVCFDGTDVVVKGLLDAFDFTSATEIVFKNHLIPDTNSAYDIGNAESKLRYLFKTDS